MLVPHIETRVWFHWSDVEAAVAKEMGCRADDLDHVFREWMREKDPEAGGDCSIGCHHNFDEQIAELEAIIAKAKEDGDFADIPDDEIDDFISDEYYGLPFLKAIKKVLGVYSTRAAFLYSW